MNLFPLRNLFLNQGIKLNLLQRSCKSSWSPYLVVVLRRVINALQAFVVSAEVFSLEIEERAKKGHLKTSLSHSMSHWSTNRENSYFC